MAARLRVQETSTCTPIKEPPTRSSTSLVVDALMRGARRWWKKTGVRSVSHKSTSGPPKTPLSPCDAAVEKHHDVSNPELADPALFNTSCSEPVSHHCPPVTKVPFFLLRTHAVGFKAARAPSGCQEWSASVQPTCFVTCVRFICPQNNFTAFLQLLPVLVLILISVFTQMMATNPPYSLFYKP